MGRIVSSLEGGYNLSALARSVGAHLKTLAQTLDATCVFELRAEAQSRQTGTAPRSTILMESAMPNSIFDTGLDRNAANFAALSPLSFVERSATVFPDLPAVVHGSGRGVVRYTWREVYARSRRLAHALQKRGIGRGDTVAVMLPNTPEMVEAHYGVPMRARC